MKKYIFLLVLLTLGLIMPINKVKAQDFKKIVEIVVELENTLKQLIAKEETQRLSDVSEIKQEISGLQQQISSMSASFSPGNQTDYEALDRRVGLLENSIQNIKSIPEMESLTSQLNQLISELKIVIGQAKNTTPQPDPLFNIKVGILAQAQAQAVEETATAVQENDPNYSGHWQRQLFVRRFRVILAGSVAKNTSFFFESDAPNIGKLNAQGVKDTKFYMYVQDAYIQHTFMPELSLIAGLQLVGISRNGLQSAAALMAADYGSYQFLASGALDNSIGRDFGVNLRGFLFDERFEYRAGMFSGKSTNLYSPFRFASRFNYNFADKEKGAFYTGTTLGKGEILSLGAGVDMQGTYLAYSFDGFADFPLGDLGSVTASASMTFLDGGGSDKDSTVFTGSIPKQTVIFGELGYFFKDLDLQPYVKFESRNVNADVLKQVGASETNLDYKNKLLSGWRMGFGLNYFISGHNANIKILYEILQRNRPSIDSGKTESATSGMLTIQFQYFTL